MSEKFDEFFHCLLILVSVKFGDVVPLFTGSGVSEVW